MIIRPQKLIQAPLLIVLFTVCHLTPALGADTTPFHNESEAGVVITSGNSRAQSYNFKQLNSYEFEGNVVKLTGHYLGTQSNGVESARNWGLGLRYERILSEKFSVFASESLESDIFAGYLQRYNTDVGGKTEIVKTEDFNWISEGGYRYTTENRLNPPNANSHFVRLYTELNRAWTKSFSTRYWLEVLPNLTDSQAYQVNSELSLSAVLTSLLSLKTAYGIKYNHLPAPGVLETTDSQFTTALVAKF